MCRARQILARRLCFFWGGFGLVCIRKSGELHRARKAGSGKDFLKNYFKNIHDWRAVRDTEGWGLADLNRQRGVAGPVRRRSITDVPLNSEKHAAGAFLHPPHVFTSKSEDGQKSGCANSSEEGVICADECGDRISDHGMPLCIGVNAVFGEEGEAIALP